VTAATLTKAEAINALELYGQHHPECAAVWPEKPCDCGLAAIIGEKPVPAIDRQAAEEEPLDGPVRRRRERPTLALTRRTCVKCGHLFDQPRRQGRPFAKCEDCR
jgi:hypothetical protein